MPVKNFLVGLSISPVEDIVDDEESVEAEDLLRPFENVIHDEPIAGKIARFNIYFPLF